MIDATWLAVGLLAARRGLAIGGLGRSIAVWSGGGVMGKRGKSREAERSVLGGLAMTTMGWGNNC